LKQNSLYPVFQPIVSLTDAYIHAHEALVRGPVGTPLHTPDALLHSAADENLSYEFESACVVAALRTWGKIRSPGRLFVNISS
ncbi:MAG: diguanylate phosphodiesterase, partial [Rhodoferax sp.]